MEINLVDRWDDVEGNQYLTVKFNGNECVDIKRLNDEERFIYVMQCHDGNEVYDYGSMDGYRNLTDPEHGEIMQFAEEQFEVEEMLDKKVG